MKSRKVPNKAFFVYNKLIVKIGEEYLNTIIGRYVWSKSGRDKDRLLIIIDIYDDQHVLVADGELRRAAKPKKKKLKHLNITNKVAEEINEIVTMKKKLLDADLQRAINKYYE
ncbi:MAG: RNA-binding protein [Acetivibrionales bacterium]|jgi:large subunit ribosomal protein L14e